MKEAFRELKREKQRLKRQQQKEQQLKDLGLDASSGDLVSLSNFNHLI